MSEFFTNSERKRILFICAYCRLHWDILDKASQEAIIRAELYADSKIGILEVSLLSIIRVEATNRFFSLLSSNIDYILSCFEEIVCDRELKFKLWKHITGVK